MLLSLLVRRPARARGLGAVACVLSVAAFRAGPLPAQEATQDPNRTCFMCHGDPENFSAREDGDRLIVTRDEFEGSVHGGFGMACTTCHSGFAFPHPDEYTPVRCEACHGSENRLYAESVHGYALARGNERAPTCAGCHGEHDIRRSDDPESRTYHGHVAETCTACHSTGGLLTDQYVKLPSPALQFAQSVHGKAGSNGDMAAATCTDCHGVHDLKGHNDPSSKINRLNVASTCGACHVNIRAEYDRSIHGRAVMAGVGDSPTCTDCHGEHLILRPDDPDAATHSNQLAVELCGTCHSDPVIIAKYSLRDEVVLSYEDSYHAWARARDDSQTATCVSCHTAHLVLPEADPASSISESNVVDTCRQCHEDATLAFAQSYDHAAAAAATNRGRRIVTAIYISLIVVVIGGMAIHNALILNYYLVEKRRREQVERAVVRFDRIQIAQHITLALAFILLVLTGFALRYPEALWVKWTGLGLLSEPARSVTHRIAGLSLILFSIVHLVYVIRSRRGREEFRAMAPNFQDLKDFIDNMSFHTWRTKRRPRFGRYDYTQKAEYWALVWGTGLMAITGLVLWFPVIATALAPTWIVSISETIHFYEAWLAMLAIIVWHFFFVIFHPEVYPMSWIWLTGRMPEHELQSVHGRWYDDEVAEMLDALPPGEVTAGDVAPPPDGTP
jgi:formate dehydrogenase gamma subunit